MVEVLLEQKIKENLAAIISAAGIDDIQIIGSYDVSEIKAVEESGKTSYIIVKVNPRSYASPTIPTCTVECAVSLTVRSDIDYSGKSYVDLMDAFLSKYQSWQQCLDEAHDDFSVDGWAITGFVLGEGSTAIDRNATVFTYTHSFTLYGIIN